MKITRIIICVLALALMAYNLTFIDPNKPLEGDSFTAVIVIIFGGCCLLLMAILSVVKKIEQTLKNKL